MQAARGCDSTAFTTKLYTEQFCTPSCNIFHTLLSTGLKSGEFGNHSWVWINSRVSPSNNAIVACTRWAFQVSQDSVETLFRWGGKCLHHVASNSFRKLCAKFHHNCPSFVGDIRENILVSFFRTQCIATDDVYIFVLCRWQRRRRWWRWWSLWCQSFFTAQ